MMTEEEIHKRINWHRDGYIRMEARKTVRMQYLGRRLIVPREVMPPAWMSKLLGKSVLEEVRETDRVLDMGTGSGINAILAASRSSSVVAADVNPYSVETGERNARLNNVSSRIKFVESDLFERVRGKFDLIIFDPPFRWFAPRDLRERAVADENFRSMTAFFSEVKDYLRESGRILVFYGDTGDLSYFLHLLEIGKFEKKLIRSRGIQRGGRKWMYYAWRLTVPQQGLSQSDM